MIVYFSLKALSKQLLISKALQSFVLIQARINEKNSGGGGAATIYEILPATIVNR